MRYLTLFVLLLVLCSGAFAQQRAQNFTATSLNGKTVDLEALKGKVVVMAFWTTRCPICHSEIPKLNKLAGSYSAEDVVFLAPTTESEEKIAWYTARSPFNFDILPNQFGLMLKYAQRDKDGNLDMGYPSYFVIGPTGILEYRANGWNRIKTLESTVNRLIVKRTTMAVAER